MEGSTSNSAPPPNGTNKSKLPQIDPFTSAESIVQSLQVQDAQLLQASLVQIDKRAAALNAKPAPRGSPDLLLDYLKKYPGCDGIFHAWDYANKTNNSPLSTAILSCLTSLIRLLSTDPFTPSPELIKTLLSAKYTPYLERALNPGRNDVTTSALRLCNVLVGFAGGRFAKKLFSAFGWSPKVTTRLYKTRLRSATSANVLNKPDIRTLLVLLVLSFLSAGDTRLKSQVLETKGLVSGIFKGLSEDPEVVTNLVLEIMFSEVVQDRRVGLEARRNVFDESCINELVKLYDYALPVISDDSPLPASHPTISVHRFFYALTDWLSEQIASSPVGRSSGPQKILSNLLKSLQVTEDQSHRTLALYILERSPVLSGQFWSKFPSSLDPRLSSRWISAITFATQVVALPISSNLELPSSSDSESGAIDPVTFAPPSVQSILDTILPPSPPSSQTLTRTWYTKALTHANPLVSFLSSIFLLSILQKASKVLEAMMKISQTLEEDGSKGGRWVESMRRIREEIKNKVPDVSLIVGLMSRTAAAAAATSSVAPVKSKDKGKDSVKTADATKANESAALLRTNIALRLLYLYHRVVPSLIATLKFDFTKLPQTFAIKSESTDSAEDGAGSIEGGEGLRAMSSSYALRLAAVHESGAASFSRPGDHFKSLLPLFTLYRISSLTPSNRSLLLQTLKRQLSTPLLFGEGDEQLHEVEVWLDSLPVPIGDDDHDVDETIAWFEKIVQKTLTSPIKPKGSAAADSDEAGDEAGLSPLMKTALNALETAADQPSQSLQSFVQTLFINYLAHKTSIESSTTLYDSIKAAWRGHKDAVKGTLKTLADVLEVVKGGKEKKLEGGDAEARIEQLIEAGDEDKIGQVSQGFSPRKANVFVALDARPAALDAMLPRMPLPLLFLHARTTDLSKLLPLLHLHSSSPSLVPAAQIVLHRFVHAAAQDDRQSFAEALVALHVAADEQRKTAIRKRVAAKSGVYGLFETEGAKEETAQVIAQLLAGVLSAATSSDVDLVQPFASLLVSDLSATGITARVRGSTVLVPYFTDKSALAFASALVSRLPASLDTINQALLGAVLARLDTVPRSHEFDQFWIANLSTFVQASSSSNAVLQQAAEELLLKGSSIVSSTSTGSRAASTLPFVEWTEMILSLPIAFSRAQATVLSALISRSSAARARFLAYVQKKDASQFNQALEMPLKTLLEVAVVREEKIPLDESLVEAVVESVLARGEVAASSLSVVELLAAASPSAGTLVRSTLEKTLASTDRGKHKASTMALVGRLAEKDEELLGVLEAYVNGSFEGLTREFVDAKEDEQVATDLAGALASALVRHKVALKGHLVEPLVTAIATNRLNNSDAVNLAIAICKRHLFKDNEVTRHLNEIFASKAFHDYASNASTIAGASLSTVELVLALSAQSPSAAGNARSVERLVPFYRGTLSPLDQSLFALFRSIERSRSSSLSSLFAAWNPSMDSTTLLDGTRIGALGAVRKAFVRRSWLRAFASTRNVYTTEEDAKTYDPRFLVAFTLALIEEDTLKPQEWTTLLESGVVGTVIAALAAADDGLRTMARATLALMHKKVEPLTFRERDEVVLLLAHCRNATFSPAGEPIPSTIALFLAHCAFQLGTPASPLYPAFTRFLLQRSTIDMRDVPMFYNMMYASKSDEWAAAPREERGWMIRFLTQGLVRTQDWKIYRRRQVFELVASLFQSSRPDAPLRKLILEFIIRATTIPTAARELLSRNGLVGWVAAQTPVDSTERRHLATILGNLCRVMTFDKLTGIADLLDALTAVIGADVTAIDATSLLTLLRYIISRLPVPAELSAPSPTYVLTLDRLSALLSSLASTLSTTVTAPVAESFYAATMSLAFVRFEAGLRETRRDGELWKLAIELGLQAGVEDLGKAVLQLQ